MLSFALGLDLFHEAKADSKRYFSFVEGKVMSASDSKNLPEPLGSKISTLQFDLFFVCVSIISLILSCLSWWDSWVKLVLSLSSESISFIWCILIWVSMALYLCSAWFDLM